MKKMNVYLFASLLLCGFCSLEGVDQPAQANTPDRATMNKNAAETKDKDYIMRRDQIENTDVLAIPLDDSEVEDEEEINRAEKREVFPLPRGQDTQK